MGIGVTTCETAAGWIGIAWSAAGLVAVTLPRPHEAAALRHLPQPVEPTPQPPPGLDIAGLAGKLRGYFCGEDVEFCEPLDPGLGTAFQRQVWSLPRAIPRGETRTYGQLARLVGRAGAARAVGQAIARTRKNPDKALKTYFKAVPEADRGLETKAFRVTLPLYASSQVHDAARWQAFADFALKYGLIGKRVDVRPLLGQN